MRVIAKILSLIDTVKYRNWHWGLILYIYSRIPRSDGDRLRLKKRQGLQLTVARSTQGKQGRPFIMAPVRRAHSDSGGANSEKP